MWANNAHFSGYFTSLFSIIFGLGFVVDGTRVFPCFLVVNIVIVYVVDEDVVVVTVAGYEH